MRLTENQYLMAALCFLLIPIAVYLGAFVPGYSFAAFIPLALSALLARLLKAKPIKSLCYLALGFASYWIAGTALYAPLGSEWRMLSFIPFLGLACANAIAALVTYNDGEVAGTLFAGASLVAVLLTKGPLDSGGIDRFLITGLLFALASVIFVKFTAWARGAGYASYNALKASIVAGLIYGLIYVLRVFDISVLDISKPGQAIAVVSPIFANAWWATAVTGFFAISVILVLYELGLYILGLQRVVAEDYVALVRIGETADLEKKDPYVALVAKLEDFFERFATYDVTRAAKLLWELEQEYYSLASKGTGSPVKANAGRMLVEARGMLLGTKLEALPVAMPAPKEAARGGAGATRRMEPIDVPDGTVVLVEGPIGSRKEGFCLDLLKKRLDKGEKAMVVSFEPEKEGEYVGDDENLRLVKVEQNINDMALSISRALEEKPKIVFFNILYWLAPNYSVTTLSGFLASTLKKLKASKSAAIFVVEQEMLSPQMLSTLESVFDGVIEFATPEDGGKAKSKYRVKEFKFRKFDAEWRDYW